MPKSPKKKETKPQKPKSLKIKVNATFDQLMEVAASKKKRDNADAK